MEKIEINISCFLMPQRRKDAKEILSALAPSWQKKYLIAFFCSIIYINLFRIVPGYSQSDSLNKYLEIAVKNNPTVLQRFNEFQAQLQKIPQVASLPDPELSAGVFLSPMELVSGNQIADLRLMQMIPWFGVLKYGKDEMSLMANAKFELFRDTKLQVCYDVQRTWYELYKVQQDINISEKNLEILKLIERLALTSFKSASSMQTGTMGTPTGSSGLTDIYRIQIESGDLENNIALLKNQQTSIIAKFNTYLNRQMTTPVYTNENITRDSLEFSLAVVSDSMLANNPMLGMLNFEKQSLDAREKMVTRMGYPMVGLGLNYSLISKSATAMGSPGMNGKDMVMPMVVLTLPIYRKRYTAMQNEAGFLKAATSENYQATANSLQTEYYQAILLYQDARRRIKLYKNQYELASKSLDLMLKSFSTSSSGLTDVLRLRQQTLDYELKQVEAVADFNTSIAWLRRLGNLEITEISRNR
jgi:outer membrane protein TolC